MGPTRQKATPKLVDKEMLMIDIVETDWEIFYLTAKSAS